MSDFSGIIKQLVAERDRIDTAIAALQGIRGRFSGKRRLSAAARERIAAAQRARWANFKRAKKA